MSNYRDIAERFNQRVFGSRLGATARWGTTVKRGAFFSKPRDVTLNGLDFISVGISFDMHYDDDVAQLDANELITIDGEGTFRFQRELQRGGNDSGVTTLVLAAP